MKTSTDIAHMIRHVRKQSGLSQQELAQLAGIGKTAVFDIENGKKNNFRKKDFMDYFYQLLQLNAKVILQEFMNIKLVLPDWVALITHSSLSNEMQTKYIGLLEQRCQTLEL